MWATLARASEIRSLQIFLTCTTGKQWDLRDSWPKDDAGSGLLPLQSIDHVVYFEAAAGNRSNLHVNLKANGNDVQQYDDSEETLECLSRRLVVRTIVHRCRSASVLDVSKRSQDS